MQDEELTQEEKLTHSEPLTTDEMPQIRKEKTNPAFTNFLKEIEELKTPEAKIEKALKFMELAIAQEDSADFKGFWDVRMKCLELFKENVPPFLRNQLWNKFSELSKEARRLKDILDEQSNFAAEQIDMATAAIEKGLSEINETIANEPDLNLPPHAYALKGNFNLYSRTQAELAHLNLFATRITSLRKELIKTDMRVRVKNKFFERLSKAGDLVFPRRKALIQEISQAFLADVERFIQQHFVQESRLSVFDLREEIKALQSCAKQFTLNTQVFGKTRLQLSECWDKLKEKDKERKAEFDKKKEVFKENAEALKTALDETFAKFDSGEINMHQAMDFLDGFTGQMRAQELGKDEVKDLREQVSAHREKIQGLLKIQEEERKAQENLRSQQKRELFEEFQNRSKELLEKGSSMGADELIKERDLFVEELQKSTLGKSEKLELEKALKALKDVLRQKREDALLALPADERLALEQLKELLSEKQEHRQEIKERMEQYRKLLGSSGLSFEKSLDYNARALEEKEAYEKAQVAVREIEKKIENLEMRLS